VAWPFGIFSPSAAFLAMPIVIRPLSKSFCVQSNMTASSPAPKEAVKKPSYFMQIFLTILTIGALCSGGPFPFRTVALVSFGVSYLIHFVKDDSPSALFFGSALIAIYLSCTGLYRLLIYNRYLDPLLAIPGPKVSHFDAMIS